jgi:signal transduction histidine kinase
VGLTISRAIVEAHGGTLEVASDGDGHGATFTITLPVPRRPETPPSPDAAGSVPRRQP